MTMNHPDRPLLAVSFFLNHGEHFRVADKAMMMTEANLSIANLSSYDYIHSAEPEDRQKFGVADLGHQLVAVGSIRPSRVSANAFNAGFRRMTHRSVDVRGSVLDIHGEQHLPGVQARNRQQGTRPARPKQSFALISDGADRI